MAKQVENRVVEMEFKNKDFEKAVAVTMESLEELNKKLEDLNKINTSGFDKLTESANNVDFSRLSASIDYIASRFSVVGIAVQGVKERIVEEMAQAANAINQVFSRIEDTIAEKGKARAMNIAQAKFQLEGLGIAWKDVSESIDTAVNDTRFGMDEAAMAASQLAASGVQLGDEMTHALLGISGVASMTNSEYSEMARIFTSIAGVGKVYRQQLNMISSRGLNATAAIAKYLGTSEAAVNEMISSKDDFIDFTTFANAMFESFGKQAKKGNDLFTGALANAKAALGRIGEKFYTPFYEYARQVLVSVKPVINDINKEMSGMFSSLDKFMGTASKLVNKTLEEIHRSFTEEGYQIDIFGKTINTKEEFDKIMDWVVNVIDKVTIALTGGSGLAATIGDTLFNVFLNIYDIMSAIGQAIYDVFGQPTMNDILFAITKFHDFVEETRLTEKQLENLKRTFRGVTSALDILFKTVSAVYRTILKPILNYLGLVTDSVGEVTGDIGDMIYSFDQIYDPFAPLSAAVNRFLLGVAPFAAAIKDVGTSIGEAFTELTGISSIEDVFNTIEKVGQDLHIADIFYAIGGSIVWALNMLVEFKDTLEQEGSLKDYIVELTEQNKVLSWIRDTFVKIKTTLGDIFSGRLKISEALGLDKLKKNLEWLNPLIETFKEHYKTIFEADEVDIKSLPMIDQFVIALKNAILNLDFEDIFGMIGAAFYAYWVKKSIDIKSYVAKTFGNFVEAFQKLSEGITGSLNKMTKETNAEKILKIAGAIALLAASILLLGKMNADEMMQGIAAITLMGIGLAILVKVLGKTLETTRKVDEQVDQLADPGGTKKTKEKGKGKNKITIVVEKLSSTLTETKRSIEETIKDISSVPALILSFGAAVFMIGSAVAKIAKYADNQGTVEAAMVFMTGMMIVMSIAVYKLAELAKDGNLDNDVINAIATTFLLFGVAIKLIATSIAEIAAVSKLAGMENILVGVGSMLATAAVLLGIVYGFALMQSKMVIAGPLMIAMAGSFALVALGMSMLALPIISIAAITAIIGENGIGLMWNAVAIISVLSLVMAAIVACFGALGAVATSAPAMLAGAASMLIIALAINSLLLPLAAITAIAAVDTTALMDAVTVIECISLVMAGLVLLFGVLGGATSGIAAAGMLAGAASMWIIAKAMQAMIIPIAALAALESQMPNGLGGVFKDIAIGLGLLAAAGVVVELIAPAFIILQGFLTSVGVAAFLVGAAIKGAGEGVLFFVSALALLQTINFDTLAQKIGEAGAAMIHGFTSALMGGIPDIQNGFVALITAGVGALVSSAGMITEACIALLLDVVKAIDNHAKDIGFHLGHALMDIVFYAFLGLAGSMADIIGRAFGASSIDDASISDFLMEKFLPKKEDNSLAKKVGDLFNFTGKKEVKDSAEETGEEAGETTVDAYADTLSSTESQQKVGDAGTELAAGIGKYIDLNAVKDSFSETGDVSIEGLTESLDIKGGKSLEFENLADMAGGTYVNTLEGYQYKSENAGVGLGKSAIKGVQKSQKSHSPSKEAIKLGKYFIEGYVEGLTSGEPEKIAENKAMSIVDTFAVVGSSINNMSLDPIKEAIASIGTLAVSDVDMEPTISPVLDMSNINSGFQTLDSMLSRSRSIALATDVSNMNEASRSVSYEIQNNNRSSLDSRLDSLNTRFQQLGDAILNRQIVLDSGALVGGLVDPMDASLGVRAIRAQRSG